MSLIGLLNEIMADLELPLVVGDLPVLSERGRMSE